MTMQPDDLQHYHIQRDGKSRCLVIVLSGELTNKHIIHCGPELPRLIQNDNPIVALDLSQVTFIDSAGMDLIVDCFKQIRARKAKMVLVGLQDQPQRVLHSLKIDKLMICLATIDQLEDLL